MRLKAMKQTSAEPLACSVRQPIVFKKESRVARVTDRAAARSSRCQHRAVSRQRRDLVRLSMLMKDEPTQAKAFFIPKSQRPNKAPEPTTMAVTPRAIALSVSHISPASARGAPAMVVAHL